MKKEKILCLVQVIIRKIPPKKAETPPQREVNYQGESKVNGFGLQPNITESKNSKKWGNMTFKASSKRRKRP
jgi:hypothetical protein